MLRKRPERLRCMRGWMLKVEGAEEQLDRPAEWLLR